MCLTWLLVLCPYVFTRLTCLLSSNILHAYMLASFFDILCPISFIFKKLNHKNSRSEKFLLIQRSIRTHLNVNEGIFFAKNINGLKLLIIFAKRLHHRFSTEFYTHFIFIDANLKTYILK